MAKPGFTTHPKFRRLVHSLGMPEPHVYGHVEYLWATAYGSGDAIIGDAVDVALAAKWTGDPKAFVTALAECGGTGRAGLIEPVPGRPDAWQIHDLAEHAPSYVVDRGAKAAELKRERTCERCRRGYRSGEKHSRFCSDACRVAQHRVTHGNEGVRNSNARLTGANALPRPDQTRPGEREDGNAARSSVATADAAASGEAEHEPATGEGKVLSSHGTGLGASAALTLHASTRSDGEDSSPIVLTYPTARGKKHGSDSWHLRESLVRELVECFPKLDVVGEGRQALAWIKADPGRRKTGSGMRRFLTTWLTNAQNRGRGRSAQFVPRNRNRLSPEERGEYPQPIDELPVISLSDGGTDSAGVKTLTLADLDSSRK